MQHRMIHMISTVDLMKNNPDDWREKLNQSNKVKGKIVLAVFTSVIVLCLLIRLFV